MRKEKRKRIILTGICWYELTGLWQLLSVLGHDVCRASPGKYCTPDAWDLVIVALSAEPVAGWGRYLPWVCELRERVSGKMLVLVPEGLKRLNVLRSICPVCSGGENLQQLSIDINAILTSGPVQTDRFSLTQAQRWALKHFSEGSGGKDRPLNQY